MADPTYIGVPLPEYEKRIESPSRDTSGGTTTTEISPEQKAAEAKRDENLAAEEARVAKETELKNRSSDIDTNKANDLYMEAANQAELDRVAHEKSDADIAAARENIKTKQATFDKMHPSGLFHENDTWGNILRGFGAATAGIGDSIQRAAAIRAGHAAPTIDTVGDIISNDLAKQRIQIDKLKDSVVQAHTGLSDANEARAQMMADRHQAAATAYDRLIRLAAAKQAALGKDNNAINASEEIAKLRDKRNKELAEVAAPTGRKVESHFANKGQQVSITNREQPATAKGPTESQAKLADLSKGLQDELKTIEANKPLSQDELAKVQDAQLASNSADSQTGAIGTTVARVGRAVGVIPRTKYEGLSPAAQKSMNAWDAAVELRARQLTGAGMPETEAIREARTLGYSPGDTPEMMQQKIQRLKDAAERGIGLSGQAGPIVSRQGQTSAPAVPTAPAPTQPPPFVPQTPAQTAKNAQPGTDKLQAIQLLKTGKISAGLAPTLKKRFGITDEDLR